jgi:hypothetical protein
VRWLNHLGKSRKKVVEDNFVPNQMLSSDHEADTPQAKYLRNGLRRCFLETSRKCSFNCRDIDRCYGAGWGDDLSDIAAFEAKEEAVRSAIEKWREGSQECITKAFEFMLQ